MGGEFYNYFWPLGFVGGDCFFVTEDAEDTEVMFGSRPLVLCPGAIVVGDDS